VASSIIGQECDSIDEELHMVRVAAGHQKQTTRWVLPRPFHRTLKAALQSSGVGIALGSELRRVIRQILDSPDTIRVPRDDLMASLRLALVESAMELGFPPGAERNELLARMVAVCQEELYQPARR
jgi:hypothetical protein